MTVGFTDKKASRRQFLAGAAAAGAGTVAASAASATGGDPLITDIQEWAQARGQAPPKYEVISQSGPDHAPDFLVQVILESGETADALAGSKRQAEQMAAKSLLQTMRELI